MKSAKQSNGLSAISASVNRKTKLDDLRGVRDLAKGEAELARAQILGVKARIFDTFRKIERRYKRTVQRAAKRIVQNGE